MLLDDWIAFLKEENPTLIKRDEWSMLLKFISMTQGGGIPDDIDAEDCWPCLMDDFAEFVQKKKSKGK